MKKEVDVSGAKNTSKEFRAYETMKEALLLRVLERLLRQNTITVLCFLICSTQRTMSKSVKACRQSASTHSLGPLFIRVTFASQAI